MTISATFDQTGTVYSEGGRLGGTNQDMRTWTYNLSPGTKVVSFKAENEGKLPKHMAIFSNNITTDVKRFELQNIMCAYFIPLQSKNLNAFYNVLVSHKVVVHKTKHLHLPI